MLHYTSGSTGKPKGALHRHHSVLLQSGTASELLDLRSDDVYWCTADQGWVTGTSYGIKFSQKEALSFRNVGDLLRSLESR